MADSFDDPAWELLNAATYHRCVAVPGGSRQRSGPERVWTVDMRSILQKKERHICSPFDLGIENNGTNAKLCQSAAIIRAKQKRDLCVRKPTAAKCRGRRREWSLMSTLAPTWTSALHRDTAPVAAARCIARAPSAHGRDAFAPERMSSSNTSSLHRHVGSAPASAGDDRAQGMHDVFLFDTT